MKKRYKPLVGDLVTLDQLAIDEFDYWGNGTNGKVGVIIRCLGTRCVVQWTDGATTSPERSVLEIVNAAR